MIDNHPILNELNDVQKEAVSAKPGHFLVLAGAGSGKTQVLVHRIVWLLEVERVSPYHILAVTFTNKAAAEMRNRIEDMVGPAARSMWVGTFHNLAHRILRAHWQAAKLSQDFQIMDSQDQYRLIRRIQKNLELDEDKWPPKATQWFINSQKDEGHRPQHIDHHNSQYYKTLINIYLHYEQSCGQSGLVDFAELLLRTHELLLSDETILRHYRERFQHILVDEFQDTNTIQYAWLKLLAGGNNYLMAVGDDDQSIYGWRGAKIENIQRLSEDFPNTTIIRLEQNYRSTSTILSAANAVIANNTERLGKNLWTDGEAGDPISIYAAYNEIDEANFIADRVLEWAQQGNARRDIGILYRSNAQSRVLEEVFIQKRIPYRIYGGLRFFDRAEIKDALAYLRMINNRSDDSAFERIVNTPTRGIGNQTLEQLREVAKAQSTPLWETASNAIRHNVLSSRAHNALVNFIQLINSMDSAVNNLQELSEQLEHIIQSSGLIEHFRKGAKEKAQAHIENLEELCAAAKQFQPENAELTPLANFLSHTALEAGDNQADPYDDCVQMMTLHSAKGLEFPMVFLSGTEEGLFPHPMATEEEGRLEEERRLCYVGMTRAIKKLYLTYAESRRLHGNESRHRASRFIQEIPKELVIEVRMSSHRPHQKPQFQRMAAPSMPSTATDTGFQIGQYVSHPKFGAGTVINYEGQGAHARIQVNFKDHGSKWLVISYANLEPA